MSQATFSTTFPAPVSHSITAVYAGDAHNYGSTAQPLVQSVTWAVATFSTSSLPAGADSITAVYGGDSNFSGGSSSAPLVETVVRSGAASLTTTFNVVGVHQITATYAGDGINQGGTTSATAESIGSACPWTATVMPSGKSILVQCARPNPTNGFTLADGYELRNTAFNADGTTAPFPTISINGGSPIALTDCLWPRALDSNHPEAGYPNFFFPIPQHPPDMTIVDDRNAMVFDGTASHATTASNLGISTNASFVLCFRAANPQASPVLAGQGDPLAGGWQLSLGGTASAMTVTFTGGGKSVATSQLTSYYYNTNTFAFGQAYQPLSNSGPRTYYGPTNLVGNQWYRAVVSIDPSAGATLVVGTDAYPIWNGTNTVENSFAFGTTTNATLTSWPQIGAPLILGSSASGGSFFAGKMGDVEIYSGTANIDRCMAISMGGWFEISPPYHAAFWPGLQGATVADISGNGAPSLNLTGVTWDADVMVAGYHANEGTDLSSSHGTFLLSAGSWTPVRWQFSQGFPSIAAGFNGRYWYSTDAGATAVFTNTSLTAGRPYNLAIAYVADFNRTTSALLTVHNGGVGAAVLGTVYVNQTNPCTGLTWDRQCWLPLGTFTPTGTAMTVVLTNAAGSGQLIADAIRFDSAQAPVMIGPSDVATITLPTNWATLAPDASTTLPAVPNSNIRMVNRSGDRFDQNVKTNPKTMKVGYNIGTMSLAGPSYWYRNRAIDQFYANGITAWNNTYTHLRGQCDVTPNGLWTLVYNTPDGTGGHATLAANDLKTGENVGGSLIVDHGETIANNVATRTYTVTGAPYLNSPLLQYFANVADWNQNAIYPPDPANPAQSIAPTDANGTYWHPNFLANMSVGFSAIRYFLDDGGNAGAYCLTNFSDYFVNHVNHPTGLVYPRDRVSPAPKIASISPVDIDPTTDADGVFGFGYNGLGQYNYWVTFVKVTTATPHNVYVGDMVSITGTGVPYQLQLSILDNPAQVAYTYMYTGSLGTGGWDFVVAAPSSTVFIMGVGGSHIAPATLPATARRGPSTINQTYTPGQVGASDWAVHVPVAANMPLADVCDLSNRTKTMPHFNLYVGISDQCAIDLGTYFANNLNSNIGIRVEYTNEPFSNFTQRGWLSYWVSMGQYKQSLSQSSPYGSWGEETAMCCAISHFKVALFRQGWQAAGRDPAQVRHFLNMTGPGMGLAALVSQTYGETDIDTGWSPYNVNGYLNSQTGAGSYPNDITAIADKMGVDQWLDHFEMGLSPSGVGAWAQVGVASAVGQGWGHWVDSSGNPYGSSGTPWSPGLKYMPGGPNGTAHVVNYEGGPHIICLNWNIYYIRSGSYMMLTKCRQMYRHPRMGHVCESFLQCLSDLGHSEFMRFNTGGYVSQGLMEYWQDLDLYNQTWGIGDGSDGKNNNILDWESNTAISPTYTAMRNFAVATSTPAAILNATSGPATASAVHTVAAAQPTTGNAAPSTSSASASASLSVFSSASQIFSCAATTQGAAVAASLHTTTAFFLASFVTAGVANMSAALVTTQPISRTATAAILPAGATAAASLTPGNVAHASAAAANATASAVWTVAAAPPATVQTTSVTGPATCLASPFPSTVGNTSFSCAAPFAGESIVVSLAATTNAISAAAGAPAATTAAVATASPPSSTGAAAILPAAATAAAILAAANSVTAVVTAGPAVAGASLAFVAVTTASFQTTVMTGPATGSASPAVYSPTNQLVMVGAAIMNAGVVAGLTMTIGPISAIFATALGGPARAVASLTSSTTIPTNQLGAGFAATDPLKSAAILATTSNPGQVGSSVAAITLVGAVSEITLRGYQHFVLP